MKGTLHKTEQGWEVKFSNPQEYKEPIHTLPLHPAQNPNYEYGRDMDKQEVDFDWCVIVDHDTGKGVEYAKIAKPGNRLDIEKLQKKLDYVLETETAESFKEWLDNKRKIILEEMPQEEWEEARNTAYTYFDIDDVDDVDSISYNEFKKQIEEYSDSITLQENEDDVEELAKKEFPYLSGDSLFSTESDQNRHTDTLRWGFKKGYNKRKENTYTEEDIINIIDEISPNWFKSYTYEDKKNHLTKIIQSLKK